jgi:hypothetical protein
VLKGFDPEDLVCIAKGSVSLLESKTDFVEKGSFRPSQSAHS